jgi:hypothetical protein
MHMNLARAATAELFETPEREPSAFDQAMALHERAASAKSWQERRAAHAAAMELIYQRLGPKRDGRMPEVKR